MEEERIFIEVSKTSNNTILYTVGGGLQNEGTMESYKNVKEAIDDLKERVIFSSEQINKNYESKKKETWFNGIIEDCDNMQANDVIIITEFGANQNLTLYIHKDGNYESEIDEDTYNIVTISTKQNDKFVDDTEDTYVTDGLLYKELERIFNYEDFKTL